MKSWTRIEPETVEAFIRFLRPMKERPFSYQYGPPPGLPLRNGHYDPELVRVRNDRTSSRTLSVDVEGYALVAAPVGFSNFEDEAAIRSVYYRAVERLLVELTGAARAITFDHNIRSALRASLGETGIKAPVERAHNDFTLRSGADRARAELEIRNLDADALLTRRFAILNVWRPLRRAVEKSPLALCDARTIATSDLVAVDLIYEDRVGETYAVQHNPSQRWAYFPKITPEEAILIKGFDSRPYVARFTAHASFEDPASRPDAPDRESIETRSLVIFDD